MNRADFLRVFQLRAPNVMWLLGAGASTAAGIRTAGQMIWHFKEQIFCAEQRRSIKACPELGDAAFRARLDSYFHAKGGYPMPGSDDEYSFYFEQAYPSEKDRHLYVSRMVAGASPSHGHLALAALAKLKLAHTIWTTNFDRLVEDALARAFGSTSAYAVVTLDSPELAEQAISEALGPVVVKLHGDFVSRRLKNIRDELQAQDAKLRRALVTECQRQGLAVVGFSGRDNSVMEMLEQAVVGDHSYPGGLFWFHRTGAAPFPRVEHLIEQARMKGVDAHLIELETFDELMLDLFLLMDEVPEEIGVIFQQRRNRLSMVEIPAPVSEFPYIRMNALPVLSAPATCRLVECSIGGTAQVREAISAGAADVVGARRSVGVICFGSDAMVKRVFEPYGISKFDLYSIADGRLEFDSAELGLLNECVARAFTRERPLGAVPLRGGWKLHVLPSQSQDGCLSTLRAAAGLLTGTIPQTDLIWAEAIRIRLERRLGRLWLLFEPSVWVDYPSAPEAATDTDDAVSQGPVDIVGDFVRERSAKRYNYILNNLYDGWVEVLVGPPSVPQTTIRAFGVADGIDASFTISRTTSFSGWGGKR